MTWEKTGISKRYIKIMGILTIIFLTSATNYISMVDAKASVADVSVYMENSEIDKKLKEPVYRIKNRTDKNIKLTQVIIEKKEKQNWIELQRKENADIKRNIKIKSGEKVYDSILISKVYNVPHNSLRAGKYRINITYRLAGKNYNQYRIFIISDDNFVNDAMSASSIKNSCGEGGTTKYSETAYILLNSDFNIDSKGKVKAVVFSENSYAYAKRTKVIIVIQKKINKRWVRYKRFKVVKKSNIAYANKQFKVKKNGTYRMKIEITVYKKNKTYIKKTYRSLEQKYIKI